MTYTTGLLLFIQAAAAPQSDAQRAEQAAAIETRCSLPKGSIQVDGEHVTLKPKPNEELDGIECAIDAIEAERLGKLGFVGNEIDPAAPLAHPLRYLAAGPRRQMEVLARAAKTSGWIIRRRARASDGAIFLQFETRPGASYAEADALLQRIWAGEFGDLELGFAPRRMSEGNPYEE